MHLVTQLAGPSSLEAGVQAPTANTFFLRLKGPAISQGFVGCSCLHRDVQHEVRESGAGHNRGLRCPVMSWLPTLYNRYTRPYTLESQLSACNLGYEAFSLNQRTSFQVIGDCSVRYCFHSLLLLCNRMKAIRNQQEMRGQNLCCRAV